MYLASDHNMSAINKLAQYWAIVCETDLMLGKHRAKVFYLMVIISTISARVGDSCLMNADCPGNSACGTDKKCACNTGLVPNYYRTHCDTGKILP